MRDVVIVLYQVTQSRHHDFPFGPDHKSPSITTRIINPLQLTPFNCESGLSSWDRYHFPIYQQIND